MSEMKVLLALLARHYTFEADNNTEWINSIGKVPKVERNSPAGGGLSSRGQQGVTVAQCSACHAT
jgi:hypothetical protein